MTTTDYVGKIHKKINHGNTGDPKALAEDLGISLSKLKTIIAHMKNELGAPIVYNFTARKYVYKEKGNLNPNWIDSFDDEIRVVFKNFAEEIIRIVNKRIE